MARHFDTETLASRGLPYPDLLPEGKIELYPMTAAVQRQVMSAMSSRKSSFPVHLIFNSCFKTEVDHELLTAGDRIHALLYIRILSNPSSVITVDPLCPNCGNKAVIDIDLRELDVTYLPEGFVEPIEVTLPMSGDVIGFHLLRGKEEIRAAKIAASSKNLDGPAAASFARTTMQIDTVNGEELGGTALNAFIEEMIIGDYTALQVAMGEADAGVELTPELECPTCSGEVVVDLISQFPFFYTV